MNEEKTIKLVSDKETPRIKNFKNLIEINPQLLQIGEVSLEVDFDADYNIFFNLSDTKDLNKQLETISDPRFKGYTIADISIDDVFNDNSVGPYYVLLAACVDSLITINDSLQEKIYEVTGRLAWVIKTEDFGTFHTPNINTEEVNDLKVAWFGKKKDYFTVISEAKNIDILFEEDLTYRGLKKKIDRYDIIYLPPCFTNEQELEREEKIKKVIKWGKYPLKKGPVKEELGKIKVNILSKEIEKLQEDLKKEYLPEYNSKYLSKILSFASEDSYLKTLEDILAV
jgi:hypothetical protein